MMAEPSTASRPALITTASPHLLARPVDPLLCHGPRPRLPAPLPVPLSSAPVRPGSLRRCRGPATNPGISGPACCPEATPSRPRIYDGVVPQGNRHPVPPHHPLPPLAIHLGLGSTGPDGEPHSALVVLLELALQPGRHRPKALAHRTTPFHARAAVPAGHH